MQCDRTTRSSPNFLGHASFHIAIACRASLQESHQRVPLSVVLRIIRVQWSSSPPHQVIIQYAVAEQAADSRSSAHPHFVTNCRERPAADPIYHPAWGPPDAAGTVGVVPSTRHTRHICCHVHRGVIFFRQWCLCGRYYPPAKGKSWPPTLESWSATEFRMVDCQAD